MSKIMQNLVVLMNSSGDSWNTSLKGGNMILNRFCIDEDAAFELRGGPNFDPVKYVKEVSHVEHMHADSLLIHPNF